MTTKSHDTLVADQFGPQAAAYVASTVHAEGEDLEQLAASVKARPVARILDLGCGGGHVSFRVAPHAGEVTAYDLSDAMLGAVARTAAARGLGNIVTRQGTVEQLPFADAAFDMVVSRFSAHHWHDVAAALAEARRVVKPDGTVVFIDVVSPGLGLLDTYLHAVELLRDPSHVRNYSEPEWRHALTRAGFAPGASTPRRLRLEFSSWVTRMRTPQLHVEAIRSLQVRMSQEVVDHFAIEADGSFTIDTMTFDAVPLG